MVAVPVDPSPPALRRRGEGLAVAVAGVAPLGALVDHRPGLAVDGGEGDPSLLVDEPDVVHHGEAGDVARDGVGVLALVLHHGVAERAPHALAEHLGGGGDAGEPLASDEDLHQGEGDHRRNHQPQRHQEQLRRELVPPRDGGDRAIAVRLVSAGRRTRPRGRPPGRATGSGRRVLHAPPPPCTWVRPRSRYSRGAEPSTVLWACARGPEPAVGSGPGSRFREGNPTLIARLSLAMGMPSGKSHGRGKR